MFYFAQFQVFSIFRCFDGSRISTKKKPIFIIAEYKRDPLWMNEAIILYLYPVILIWMSICYFLLLLLGILSFSLLIFYCSCFPLLFSFKGSFCSFWIQFVFSSLLYYHLLSINLFRRVYKDSIEICFFFSIASFQDIKCCTLMVMYSMFVALYTLVVPFVFL